MKIAIESRSNSEIGYYRFTDVNAGEIYVVTAKRKQFEFAQPTQVVNVNEDADAVDFIAFLQ
ncbi:MAG: hypothetical protein M3T96_01850 [Acidobacteriota bacterium]|nr:hypothetical protein [Acidobacteriota bacterium]